VKLDPQHLAQLSEQAITAVTQAGSYIKSKSGEQLEMLNTEGGNSLASQVVTEVDLESQRIILEALAPSVDEFQLGMLTEESTDDSSRHERNYFWCIDPLDGTLPFTENVPGYSVSIALVSQAGVPEIGVIFDPTTETLYHVIRGCGAYRNGQPWALLKPEGAPLTFVMDRSFATHSNYTAVLDQVRNFSDGEPHIFNQGGAAMNACWVMENAPAIYFKFPKPECGGGSIWDFAASSCLATELGAIATDFQGAPLDLNRLGHTFMNEKGVVFATDDSLAVSAYALLSETT